MAYLPQEYKCRWQQDAALGDGINQGPRLLVQPPPELRRWRNWARPMEENFMLHTKTSSSPVIMPICAKPHWISQR